ncbi:MAG TPA: transcription-repair coupling factor [Bacteroidota bacterium]|nr:transcription-repair coupling factor [Bacteroidota bacterium]
MFDAIRKQLGNSQEFGRLRMLTPSIGRGARIELRNIAGSLMAFVAEDLFRHADRQVLLLCSDEDRAEKRRDDCAVLLGDASVRLFAARPVHDSQELDLTSSVGQIETLKALTGGQPLLVVTSPVAVAERVPLPQNFRTRIIEITVGKDEDFQHLTGRLEGFGFSHKNFVEGFGDFAVRGGIIDVFPFVGENPVRLEFFGNRVESIREFDVLSQRSIRQLQSASLVPSLFGEGDNSEEERSTRKDFSGSLFDYLKNDTIILLDEPALIEKELQEMIAEGARNTLTYEEIQERIRRFPALAHSGFRTAESESASTPSLEILDFGALSQPSFNGSVNALTRKISELAKSGYKIFLTSDSPAESRRLEELMEDVLTSPKIGSPSDRPDASAKPQFLNESLHEGFISTRVAVALFTEHEIFNRLKRRALAKRRRFRGFSQKELQQLKRGDYVVHIDHGIGTFAGLSKIRVGGIEQEVMKLHFLENDVLYVNLNSINRVQKFSSQEGHIPALSKLGTADWNRMKERAKKRIKDIAREIIGLYARRKMEPGFAFSPDTHWQKELEASFMYEDTVDQATATIDVKNDMESSSPMDRLICGDVGFGKTEVAVRAAFKAVMNGKQVALLVPTTILAIQHYNTFQDRLSRYTTRIEHLTRFRNPKDQKKIIGQVAQGGVDILIGTHRLLSKDIEFKDLGLLIVDEEHRFGVSAKEKLRRLRANVDTLALTATPIPRTLHFSLIGARDLSLITTPPRNRLPILTEIIPGDGLGRHWNVIREAILRELHRGGQVYVVHDRVNNIDAIAEQVRTHIPEARVHVAHGQMAGHELEAVMIDFLERKYDVLVCTKIIESGVDIPSVNTIVINRADRFGLAELYQLRGRVGRSNIQAYAYLLTPPLQAIPKSTLRRLQAIEEFTELGSGFNLAMRDLEIRGAGNLLGAEQSGFIMEMGFEMYERIVREAVEELRKEEFRGTPPELNRSMSAQNLSAPESMKMMTESAIDADVDALIPDIYIESDSERLDIYRRLYRVSTEEELLEIRAELIDRFGEFPEEVDHLLSLVSLRLLASYAGFPKLSLHKEHLNITLPEQGKLEFYGEPDAAESPFQKLMGKLTTGSGQGFRLKEENGALILRMDLSTAARPADRITRAKEIVGRLRGWMT